MDDHIEVSIGQQRVRLYIITGVKEISWHRIDDLLSASDDAISRGVRWKRRLVESLGLLPQPTRQVAHRAAIAHLG
ncbi:hypothetical protein BRADI_3g54582v3 [Brachypodium distachyon]|uniref:Uncharacterized protein n=1 Tax=Brachypodium distachyon TaxID=15368 RepID=A0A0Q3JS06_BRADI|nr:hypothetical protein BRADI_3g54582v3 [Brachypodium distachyon]